MIGRLLTPRIMKFPWIAGGALWLTWLFNLVRGAGSQDIGGDFLTYYVAGKMVSTGQSPALYDMAALDTMRQAMFSSFSSGPYLRPPFYAWLFVPFSWLPYVPAVILWMALNLGCLWLSLRLLAPGRARAFAWALTFVPAWAAISFGQSEALSLLLLCLVYRLWQQEWLWAAGLVCSILLYKPPLLLGVVLLWLLEWRRDRRAVLGLVLGGAVLAGVSFGLTPEASLAYVKFSGALPSLMHLKGFPLPIFFSVRGFWLMLFPGHPTLAESLYLACVGFATLGFCRFWCRQRADRTMAFAGAICFTLLVTPYAFVYDWAILLFPAILLWQKRSHDWREIFALVWLAVFASSTLTTAQLRVLPFAVQVSVPALAFAAIRAYAELERQKVP
jgi:hypothetical protein